MKLFFVSMVFAAVGVCGEPAAPASEAPRRCRAVIVTGQDYPGHNWRETGPGLAALLGKDPRIEATIVEDPKFLASPSLSDHDVAVLHFMNWERPDPGPEARANLKRFVEGGKGLFIVHFACGAFGDWPEYRNLAGRVYDPKLPSHDPRGPFRVEIAAPDHPVTRGLAPFETDDELYTCLAGDRPIEVLATARSKVTGKNEPMAFAFGHGRGRVFHSPLGHDLKALASPGVGDLFRRGCAWAGGLDPAPPPAAAARDRPQWGEPLTRNMVSEETDLPETFDPETGTNVKWSAELGNQTYSTPVIAGGKVLIGTNNARPRDPKHKGDRGVFLCLDERSGRFLWQLVVPKREEDPLADWPNTGICSTATVEGDRVYLVTNLGEVACLDLDGLADGNDGPYLDEGRHMAPKGAPAEEVSPTDADIVWLFDTAAAVGVHQHDAAHCSVLLHGPFLYVCTSNGVDGAHKRIVAPDAPSLIVLDKSTGRLVGRDGERMAPRTIHCTWSSPSAGEVGGRPLIFFGGGDGVCYAFEPIETPPADGTVATLRKVWSFDCDPEAPKENVHRWQDNKNEGPSNITGMPVFHRGRVYVTAGGDLWHGKLKAWIKCIDASKTGDITRTGEVWSYPLERHCMSTPSVRDGLVLIADCGHKVHCLDAETGRPLWVHNALGDIWASTLVADGKVYFGTQRNHFWVLAAGKEAKVLGSLRLDSALPSSPTAANGVVYVATMTRLYALAKPKRS